jgi:hypothetical protein
MRRMGANNFEPLPPDQIKTFLRSFHTAQERVLAWVRVHTVCFPCWSPYCVDNRGNELRQVDCARELDLDESVVSRRLARLSVLGLVRVDNNGRIYLCGVVVPSPELTKDHSTNGTLPPTLRRAAESLDQQEAQALQDCLRVWKADRESNLADVVRKVRRQSDQELVQIMGRFGFRKQPRGWTRLPLATGEEVAVQASTSPGAAGEEVAVQASNGPSARPADEHGADETDVTAKTACQKEHVASIRTEVSSSARAVQQVSTEVQQANAPLTATIPAVNNNPILINRPIDSGDQVDGDVSSSSASFIKKKACDDDKRTNLEQPKYVTEVDELVAEIRKSTGITEDQGLIRGIVENLEVRGGTLRDFLDWVKPRARRLTNRVGPGFYLSEARKWGSTKNQPAPDPCPVSPTCPPVGGKCQCCGGFGLLSDGGYCQCAMGRDLERVEKRIKKKSAGA